MCVRRRKGVRGDLRGDSGEYQQKQSMRENRTKTNILFLTFGRIDGSLWGVS